MRLDPGLIKVTLIGVALRDIPVLKGVISSQAIAGSLVMAATIGFIARPNSISMLTVLPFFRPVLVGIESHTKCKHKLFQPTFSGHTKQLVRISPAFGHLIIGLQQLMAEVEPQAVIQQFQQDLPDFMDIRPLLIDMLGFMERKAPEAMVREAAEVLGARLKNLRALGQ